MILIDALDTAPLGSIDSSVYPEAPPSTADIAYAADEYELRRVLVWLQAGGRGGRTFADLVIATGGGSMTAMGLLRRARKRGLVERVPRGDVPAGKATSRWRVTQ